MKPIRVLVVGMTDTAGGVENFLMAYCGRIDPARVRFDFLTRYENAAYPEQRQAIGQTFVIPARSEDPVRYYREIRAFFDAHARVYDVIWDNECLFNDLTPLQMAAEHGVPVRIAHSHNPQNQDPSLAGKGRGALHRVQRRTLARYANVLWACSEASARWACPAMDLPFAIIPHAVDAQRFRYREDVRREVRAHYGLEDCLVLGHVGRLQHQKNQAFLLEAFARLHQREPRARLVLVGEGPELLPLEAKAVDLEISSAVLFLGHRDDVPRLLQAFDLFVMPSRFEGLGMAAVEAQAAGLPCILSSAVPKEAAITDQVTFLPPEDPDLWAECMLDTLEGHAQRLRRDTLEDITRAGYELSGAAERLTQRLESLVAEQPAFKRRFLLTGKTTEAKNDAAQARQQVQRITQDLGYIPLPMALRSADGKWYAQALMHLQTCLAWAKLFFKLHHGDLLLMCYPWFPVQTARITRWAVHLLQWKGARVAAWVQDLPSLRLPECLPARWMDQELLPRFDNLIVPTARMASYLNGQGIPGERLIPLHLQDFLTDAPMPVRHRDMSVCVAGDLSRKRNGYLHALPRMKGIWHLCGEGWKGTRADLVWHRASMEELPGAFGLVWAGESVQVISGAAGAHAMLSAPWVASRYLAAGLPLIVWKWSALADFVREHGLGLAVGSLAEIPGTIAAMREAEYDAMAEAARTWGEKLRRGGMTREALTKLR